MSGNTIAGLSIIGRYHLTDEYNVGLAVLQVGFLRASFKRAAEIQTDCLGVILHSNTSFKEILHCEGQILGAPAALLLSHSV